MIPSFFGLRPRFKRYSSSCGLASFSQSRTSDRWSRKTPTPQELSGSLESILVEKQQHRWSKEEPPTGTGKLEGRPLHWRGPTEQGSDDLAVDNCYFLQTLTSFRLQCQLHDDPDLWPRDGCSGRDSLSVRNSFHVACLVKLKVYRLYVCCLVHDRYWWQSKTPEWFPYQLRIGLRPQFHYPTFPPLCKILHSSTARPHSRLPQPPIPPSPYPSLSYSCALVSKTQV